MDENMSELVEQYNELANKLGKDRATSFKSISAAKAAILKLQTLLGQTVTNETQDTNVEQKQEDGAAVSGAEVLGDGATPIPTGDGAVNPAPATAASPMNSVGRRGPTQGVGEFCKELIKQGKSNVEILEAVKEKFQGTAKTSASCIAFYRNALKGGAASRPRAGKIDVAALEAKAQKLQTQIAQAKEVQAKKDAEAAAVLQAAQAQAAAAQTQAAEAQPQA